jgi:uncharacterized Zn finger protein
MGWYGSYYPPYVSVAKRQANAKKQVAKLAAKGQKICPVKITGFKIATTFWGKAWCDNLESYSDFSNRLPRGRSYVRNGSVVDLQIEAGKITAMVAGSSLYKVKIGIKRLPVKTWDCIRGQCAGKIGSMIELLQGKLAANVMQIVTQKVTGLFPAPAEIDMDCSCPDYAGMCKHIAAVLYGVGSRLDQEPEVLFSLRQVDHFQLVAQAGDTASLAQGPSDAATIAADQLGDIFGIDLAGTGAALEPPPPVPPIAAHPANSTVTTKPIAAENVAAAAKSIASTPPARESPAAAKKPRHRHSAASVLTSRTHKSSPEARPVRKRKGAGAAERSSKLPTVPKRLLDKQKTTAAKKRVVKGAGQKVH